MNGIEDIKSNTKVNKSGSTISLAAKTVEFFLSLYVFFELKFSDSAIVKYIRKFIGASSRVTTFVGRLLARSVEKSYLISGFNSLVEILLEKSMRYYGVAVFFYGLFSLMLAFVGGLSRYNDIPDLLYNEFNVIFPAVISVLIATVMMTSGESVASQILSSRLLSLFIFDYLYFDRKRIEAIIPKEHSHTLPVIIGMALSLLFLKISPLFVVKLTFYLVCIFMIMKAPENGVILTFFVFPFVDGKILVGLLGIVATSYFVKTIRMKRVYRVGFYDVFWGVFCFIIFICGVSSINYSGSFYSSLSVLLCFLFGFIIANTMKTTSLLERCINTLLLSSSIAALIIILLFFADHYGVSTIHPFIKSLCEMPSSLPFVSDTSFFEFFVILLPLTLSKRRIADGGKSVTAGLISFILLLTACILSFDGVVWLSVIASIIVYYCSLKPIITPLIAITAVLLLWSIKIFPDLASGVSQFISGITGGGFNLDTFVEASSRGLKLFSDMGIQGLGSGKAAVENAMTYYFGAGAASSVDNMSFAILLLLQHGIIGIIISACCYIVFLLKNSVLYFGKLEYPPKLKPYVASSIASVSFLMIKGLFFPTFLNIQSIAITCFLVYLGISVKNVILTEYVPRGTDVLGFKEF